MTVGIDVVTAVHGQSSKLTSLSYEKKENYQKDNTGKPIRVKTLGQKLYVDSVKQHDVTFGIRTCRDREDAFLA